MWELHQLAARRVKEQRPVHLADAELVEEHPAEASDADVKLAELLRPVLSISNLPIASSMD